MDSLLPENIYGHRKRLLWIIRQIENRNAISKLKGKTKVLEIGCGTGTMISIPLASLGYDVLGIDLDKKSIDFANSVNPHANAEFICCDVAELNDSYDVIILSEVLEHLGEPGNLLKACHGILTTKGVLIVTVPNGYGWFEFEQLLWDKLRLGNALEFLRVSRTINSRKRRLIENYDYWELYPSTLSSSPHVQRFTFGKIRRLVMRNGFSILDAEGSTLIAGKFSNLLFTGFKTPMKMNNWLGAMIKPLASGFYLCCNREEY